MTFFEIALRCIARGWCVFPCWPGKKNPMLKNGHLGASNDAEQAKKWWTANPSANVGIACGPSKIAVLDIDDGLADAVAFQAWRTAAGLPDTYTVRMGRRPGFGAQMFEPYMNLGTAGTRASAYATRHGLQYSVSPTAWWNDSCVRLEFWLDRKALRPCALVVGG